MRIGAGGSTLDLDSLISPAVGLSSFPTASSLFGGSRAGGAAFSAGGGGKNAGAGQAAQEALDRERRRAQELEKEVELLKRQLGKANAINEGMWKRVVEGTLGGGAAPQ
jgi:pre-rRNA-processing protein IPI3